MLSFQHFPGTFGAERARPMKHLVGLGFAALAFVTAANAQDWPTYGGDPGASRYSSAQQINRGNVGRLGVAWTYHTGEQERRGKNFEQGASEATPILADGKLLVCTPFNGLIALDPASGKELWTFDANLSPDLFGGNQLVCRGVGVWHDHTAAGACAARVFMTTNDARLLAVDA